jgi:hypothetical protein
MNIMLMFQKAVPRSPLLKLIMLTCICICYCSEKLFPVSPHDDLDQSRLLAYRLHKSSSCPEQAAFSTALLTVSSYPIDLHVISFSQVDLHANTTNHVCISNRLLSALPP